ncbi:MAG: phosphoglycerate mutase family protein [Planctomycetota bacterium]
MQPARSLLHGVAVLALSCAVLLAAASGFAPSARDPLASAPAPVAPVAPAGATLSAPAVQAEGRAPAAAFVTVVLLRHAEKATDDPRDPSLSEAGVARAARVSELFANAGVTHVFASEFRRTRDTVAPLAARAGVEVVAHPARDVTGLAAQLRALPAGSVAVVAGHSNTVPALAAALGVELPGLVTPAGSRGGPMLDEASYDRIFVLTRRQEAAPVASTDAGAKAPEGPLLPATALLELRCPNP